jgi:hypothetical protein
VAAFEVIEQILEGHARAAKDSDAAENVRVLTMISLLGGTGSLPFVTLWE